MRVFLLLTLFTGFAFADDSSGSSEAKPHGTAQPVTPAASDIFSPFRETLRRLPDPAVISLSQKLSDALKANPQLDANGFAQVVDGLSGITTDHKSQLKTGFGELFPKLGNDGNARLTTSVSDILRERNLSPVVATPGSGRAQTAAETEALRRAQEKVDRLQSELEDNELRNLMDRRADRDRRRDGDRDRRRDGNDDGARGNNSGSQSPNSGSDRKSSPSESEKASSKADPRHADAKKNDKNSNPTKFPSFSNDTDPKRSEKDSPFGQSKAEPFGSSKKSAKASVDADSKKDDVPVNPTEGGGEPGGPKSMNLGMAGERSTPESISSGDGGSGGGSGDFGNFGSGAVAGALAAASAGSSQSGSGDASFMDMNLGQGVDDSGGPSGSVAGAFQNGVNYISGSSPDSADSESSQFSDVTENETALNKSKRSEILGYGPEFGLGRAGTSTEEPGIFRTRKILQEKACRRLGC